MKRIPLFFQLICVSLFVFVTSFSLQGQEVIRCYTDEQDAILRAQYPELESHAQFEQWIQSEIQYNIESGKIIGGVYQIPVVVHVIHNGEAVGTGTNVSYAAILSQIEVLNEDFRRMFGTAGWNTNPVGADTQIEFCLAKRRPDGSAFPNGEDGVNRIPRSTAGFTAPPYNTGYIDGTIKPYTYNNGNPAVVGGFARGWSPEKYMNIWLCNISGGILGYAQFPQSPIGGMGCSSPVVATDGVVFQYNSIGKASVTGFPGPYNQGRTATHEIGHWLGLRHIWGDGGCNVDDYCNDTPVAAAANYGCPTGTNSCTAAPDQGPDMIENYMDYTNDACMNVFTNDQKQRMRAVLEGSPLRVSLINSDACTPPNSVDASVVDVLNPKGDNCAGSIIPSVVLKNRGSNNLTSATISYTIDNGTPVTYSWTGNLPPNGTATVTLPSFTAPLGNHSFRAYSTMPNGVVDPFPGSDTSGIDFAVSNGIMPNYTQDFESGSFPPDVRWYIDNTNGDCYKWSPASGISSTGTFTNNIAQVPCYGNNSTSNEDLYTPVFLLPCNATAAALKFDVAYRKRTNTSNDRLIVQISTDCGATWTNVYDKSGNTSPYLYQNATLMTTAYFPTVATDWRTETINLMSYVGATSKNIRFRFRGVSANGNNIFIDNVKFEGTMPAEVHVSVSGTEVLDEGFYNFSNTQVGGTTTATFTVSNTGTTNLILTNPITVTGTGFSLGTGFGTTTLAPGATTTFTVLFSPTSAGNATGNVTFGTNDCDEGTYNFQLNGLGVVMPPSADFSASATTVCQGSTVTFTNLSTFATSYAWSFPGGTPATSTATNPTVTYTAPGTYAVTLVATSSNGSDTETKNAYITVISSSASTLPLVEGFTSTTFPPTGWSIQNLNNSPTTWQRSGSVGYAPTAGNSMRFNNYNYADSDNDLIKIKPLDFSGYGSNELKFDVAYARYSATYQDGLEVLVSSDCGVTYTSVYLKVGTALATAPNTTSSFVPTTTQWRTETVNLSAFSGQPNVIIAFKNIAGNGNNLYVDNINVTGVAITVPPTPSFTASNSTICAGASVTYTNTTTGGATGYSWSFPGGTPASSTDPNPVVTYATPGTYSVELTATNAAGSNTMTMTNLITVTAVPAAPTITASGSTTICSGESVTLTSTAGTSYLWSNGATTQSINVNSAGTYTCQVTNASGCTSPASNSITITVGSAPAAPTITASGSTTICSGGSVTLTSTVGTSYLWSNGATTQSITVNSAGTYTCQVTNASGCTSPASNSITVIVSASPATPTITTVGSTTFCQGGSVTLTSSVGSSYLWSNGATTQSITVTASGNYSVQVTNASGCTSAASASTSVTVDPIPTITLGTTTNPSTCQTATGSIQVTGSGTGTLTWMGAAAGSQTVSLPATISNLAAGVYQITFTSATGCTSSPISASLSDPGAPTAPVITASSAIMCPGSSVTLTSSYASGNSWSNGATTQSITVTTSGSYTVSVNSGGCTSSTSFTIMDPAPFSVDAGADQVVCSGNSIILLGSSTGSPALSWNNGVQNGFPFTPISTTTYTLTGTDVNGCTLTDEVVVTVHPTPTVTWENQGTVCVYQSPFTLSGASPIGGTYSGPGVSGGVFNPTNTGVGNYELIYTYTDGNGCSASATAFIAVDGCLGILEKEVSLTIFPNPSNGMVYIRSTKGFNQLQLVDSQGKLVAEKQSDETILEGEMDLSDVANGSYILLVKGADELSRHSLILTK